MNLGRREKRVRGGLGWAESTFSGGVGWVGRRELGRLGLGWAGQLEGLIVPASRTAARRRPRGSGRAAPCMSACVPLRQGNVSPRRDAAWSTLHPLLSLLFCALALSFSLSLSRSRARSRSPFRVCNRSAPVRAAQCPPPPVQRRSSAMPPPAAPGGPPSAQFSNEFRAEIAPRTAHCPDTPSLRRSPFVHRALSIRIPLEIDRDPRRMRSRCAVESAEILRRSTSSPSIRSGKRSRKRRSLAATSLQRRSSLSGSAFFLSESPARECAGRAWSTSTQSSFLEEEHGATWHTPLEGVD